MEHFQILMKYSTKVDANLGVLEAIQGKDDEVETLEKQETHGVIRLNT